MNKYDKDLRIDVTTDEHIPMNADDYCYLYDLIEGLPFEFFYEFPQLSDIRRICEEHIEARCLGGE